MSVTSHAAVRHSAVPFATAMLMLAVALALLFGSGTPAAARDLRVGPHQAFQLPNQAAAVARDGDRVEIDPGTYADCAVWRASRLTIEATGPGVVLAGRTCQGKAIFVTAGHDITVRGITFADAHVPDHNGAGIRAEGRNLTVEKSRFLNNENGILAGGPPDSVVRVTESEFNGNGACIGACAHGIYAGQPIALLDVERSHFADTHIGHHIKSRARSTRIVGNRIEDGTQGNSSYLIDVPNGGDLLIRDNDMQKSAHSDNPHCAISIGEEGVTNVTETMTVAGNRFRSNLPKPTIFVRNTTTVPVRMTGNHLSGQVTPLTGPGTVRP